MTYKNPLFLLTFFAAVTTLVYKGHFDNDFHFDDFHTIVDNPYTRDIKNIPKFFTDVRTSSSLPTHQGYRPGLTTLNTLDFYIYEKGKTLFNWVTTTPFHISIFISYIILGFILYGVIFHFLKKISDSLSANYMSVMIVAIFWIHTANAETINYIVQRADSFSTLMLLAGFFIFIKYPQKRKLGFYLIPFIVGLMVKEPTIMLTPLAFLYVYIFEQNAEINRFFKKDNWLKIWAAFKSTGVMWILSIAFYILSQKSLPESWQASAFTTTQYLFTQPFVMVRYMVMFFFPYNLSADSDWGLIPLTDERTIVGLLIIFVLLVWSFRQLKPEGKKIEAFGIFWFFLTLLPSSSVFPLGEVTNDHRVFLPFLGLYISLAAALYRFGLKHQFFINQKIKQVGILLIFLCVYSFHAYGTIQRIEVWNDDESLWKDVTIKSPNNGRGMMNYGLALMKRGKLEEAEKYFIKAIEKAPGYSLAYINLAICQNSMGKVAEVESHYQKAITLSPYNFNGYFYYGQWLLAQGRNNEAITNLEIALEMAHSLLNARYLLMTAYRAIGNEQKALFLAKETLKLFPNDNFSKDFVSRKISETSTASLITDIDFINEGLTQYNLGNYQKALDYWLIATELNPQSAIAWNNVGSAYIALEKWEDAVVALQKSLSIDPKFERAQNNLSFALSKIKQDD